MLAFLGLASAAHGAVPLTNVLQDPFVNPQSQHQTVVEPDTFAFGSTIVSVAQVGRYFDGGASGTGFATSTNGGASWVSGTLPGLTVHQSPAGPYDRATDPVVAYDAQDGVWIAQSLALVEGAGGPGGEAIVINRSANGITWGPPIVSAQAEAGQDFDKNWIVCDNNAGSPHVGNCYQTWDDFGDGDRILMNRSTDGGVTWSTPVQTANGAFGLGGQPVVQPNGTVVIPASNAFETAIIAFRSINGGVSWSSSVTVAPVPSHNVAGNLRTGPLPSAEIDGAGKVYVVWQDCRFRKGCKSNDIVMSTSTDGLTWSPVTRVPLDSVNSSVDHFIPGIGVDTATSGGSARLALTYYFYRGARCGTKRTPCQLEVGHSQSANGGTTWSTPTDVAGPFPVTWAADTTQGRMVGDYMSTSWLGGRAWTAVVVAGAPAGAVFDEDLYVPTGGLAPAAGGFAATSSGEHPVAGAASDHASPRSAIRSR
ncbi:MAG: sialidase family protein [Solirubrobacteraceae bacterium]